MEKNSERRKMDNRWRYFYSFFIAVFLLLLGFLISYSLNLFEFNRVSNIQEEIYYDFYKTKLYADFFKVSHCDKDYLNQLGQSLDFQGNMLTTFEEKFGKNDPRVLERKKFYYLLQISHMDFIQQLEEDCDSDYTFILFFYSNLDSESDYSERLGKILGHVKSGNPDILIYSFDYHSDDALISGLKSKYGVDRPGVIVVDGVLVEEKIQDIDQLREYLG